MHDYTGNCMRCGEESGAHIMSMYSKAIICLDCKDIETERPDYQAAVKADEDAIRRGDFNFEGLGEPVVVPFPGNPTLELEDLPVSIIKKKGNS